MTIGQHGWTPKLTVRRDDAHLSAFLRHRPPSDADSALAASKPRFRCPHCEKNACLPPIIFRGEGAHSVNLSSVSRRSFDTVSQFVAQLGYPFMSSQVWWHVGAFGPTR
ncbi:hypothetical protein RvY_08312-1 [Ramazzottius varieornatus]|uniref:Uncharacterized protein n=1 Tax=Ramazzottius varieornatus TaxID=947166 RepID=A0A1D1VB41_RAMVA|nr:hypothetical protein RvY_08312-1 [Ramazzottius varieornatus]